jgi:hypothetical protein
VLVITHLLVQQSAFKQLLGIIRMLELLLVVKLRAALDITPQLVLPCALKHQRDTMQILLQ